MGKKFIYKLFIGAYLSIHSFVFAFEEQIIEIKDITIVRNYIQDDSLVLLNVGGTLFSPSSMLADYQWRQYFEKRVNQLILNSEIASTLIDEVKALIVEKVPKICLEPIMPSFIAELQGNRIPVLGYTKRSISTTYAPNNGQITSNHLAKMGIDLSKTLSYYLADEFHDKDLAFQYGIIFTNKNPIGLSIANFLTDSFSHVILVDDSLKQLQEGLQVLNEVGIRCQGLRYNRIDHRKKSFDHNLATIEFFAFINKNQLITDEEALEISSIHPLDYEMLLNDWILQQNDLILNN